MEHHGDVGRSDPAAAGSIRKEEMSRVRCCKSERSYGSCEAVECLPASVLCAVSQSGADVALTLTDERLRAASPALYLSLSLCARAKGPSAKSLHEVKVHPSLHLPPSSCPR